MEGNERSRSGTYFFHFEPCLFLLHCIAMALTYELPLRASRDRKEYDSK